MSAETDQILVLLATEAGCLETLRQTNAFARVDIRRAIDTAFDGCARAIVSWPLMSSRHWVNEKREEFKRFVMSHPDRGYSSVALVCMCDRVNADLMEKYWYDAGKMQMLEPIHKEVHTIHDFCDPEGANFPAFEKSDELLDELYRITGFVRNGEKNDKKHAPTKSTKKRKPGSVGPGRQGHAGTRCPWRKKVRNKAAAT